jgi:hypothetical protein
VIKLDHYRLSPEEIARYRCLDCGRNVIEIGDFCMLKPEIWEDELRLNASDNLCIRCIEARLGRKLRPGLLSFCSTPTVEGYPPSDVLLNRLGVRKRKGRERK